MERLLATMLVVIALATSCQGDRQLTIVNGCGVEIEFFRFAATGTRQLNEATLGDSIRLELGEQRRTALYSDVESLEIYSSSLDLVLSFPTDGGEDVEVVIDSGCDVLEVQGR